MSRHSQATAKEQNITIKSSGGLSDSDIEKMVRDAEQYATADKAKKEAIEAKNTLETAIYSAEKSFAEYKVRALAPCQRDPKAVPAFQGRCMKSLPF